MHRVRAIQAGVVSLSLALLPALGLASGCADDLDRCLSAQSDDRLPLCERLCEHAQVDACNQVGNIHSSEKRPAAAQSAWKRACAMGKVEACAKAN